MFYNKNSAIMLQNNTQSMLHYPYIKGAKAKSAIYKLNYVYSIIAASRFGCNQIKRCFFVRIISQGGAI